MTTAFAWFVIGASFGASATIGLISVARHIAPIKPRQFRVRRDV